MVDGRTAVHEACKEGYITVLKALLKFSPNLEILVISLILLLMDWTLYYLILYVHGIPRIAMESKQFMFVPIGKTKMYVEKLLVY